MSRIILETSRLLLREFEESDAAELFALNSDREVIRYTGDEHFEDEAEAREFILNYTAYSNDGYGRWACILKASGAFIGFCGLRRMEDGEIDIGFRVFKNFWGQGYATEAAKACLEYGFNVLELDSIIGRAALENKVSIRVLEKLGMIYERNDDCHGLEAAIHRLRNPLLRK